MSADMGLHWAGHGEYWDLHWCAGASCWALTQYLGEASVEILTQWGEISLAPYDLGSPVIRARASAGPGIAATHALATEVERGPRWVVLVEDIPILLARYEGCLAVCRRGDEQGRVLGMWSPDWAAWIDDMEAEGQRYVTTTSSTAVVQHDRCPDCGLSLAGLPAQPAHDDDTAWAAIAALHAPDCMWIRTRGIPW